MKKLTARQIALNGVVAGLYAAITILTASFAFGNIQFRIADSLCVLVVLEPSLTVGLTLGCLISNIFSTVSALDIVIGTAGTLLGCLLAARVKKDWLVPLPVIFANAVLVGAMLIAFGIVKLIGYFSRDLYRLAFQFDLALGIFLVVLGAIILLNPTRAMTFLCLMLGIAIMADGLFKLQTALDARRFGLHSWGLILAFALLTGAIGGLLAARPAESVGTLTILLGLSVLFEGLMNLCVALFAVKVIRKEQPEVVETWFESEKEER